jgi:putative membrane protein insertion efficiency factor
LSIAASLLVAVALLLTPAGPGIAVATIHAYQHTLSPVFARAGLRCRFSPSCSSYAEVVIARDGLLAGGWKAVRRVARCGPWTPMGTVDQP